MNDFLMVLYLGLATSAISVTSTRAGITKEPRQWISDHIPKIAGLFHCPYCFSHWVSVVFVLIYKPVTVQKFFVVDLVVSCAVVIALAALTTGIIISLIPSLKKEGEEK